MNRDQNCRRARLALIAAAALLPPVRVDAQIPGASKLNMDVDVARARAEAMAAARTFFDGLEDAWRGEGAASLESHYLDEATVSAPRGPWIAGAQVAEFARAARLAAPDMRVSIVDFEHSEHMAYLFGAWEAPRTPARARPVVT